MKVFAVLTWSSETSNEARPAIPVADSSWKAQISRWHIPISSVTFRTLPIQVTRSAAPIKTLPWTRKPASRLHANGHCPPTSSRPCICLGSSNVLAYSGLTLYRTYRTLLRFRDRGGKSLDVDSHSTSSTSIWCFYGGRHKLKQELALYRDCEAIIDYLSTSLVQSLKFNMTWNGPAIYFLFLVCISPSSFSSTN